VADTKVSALTALTVINVADVMYIVDDPDGTPLSRKITLQDVHSLPDDFELRFGSADDAVIEWNGTDLLIDYDKQNGGLSDLRIQEDGTDRLTILTGGDVVLETANAKLYGADAAGPALLNESSSATNPTLVPDRGSLTDGIGGSAIGNYLSIITNSLERVRIADALLTVTTPVEFDSYGQIGNAEAATINNTWFIDRNFTITASAPTATQLLVNASEMTADDTGHTNVHSAYIGAVAISGTSTITNVSTLYINDASSFGGGTITNGPYALFVDAGTSRFDGDLDLSANAVDIILDTTTGTKIGTATSQKLGFFNATPVVQTTHIADPSGGGTVDAEARTAINAILADLASLGLQAAS
jgi:hypothetical protein